jgi:hypothetical protein
MTQGQGLNQIQQQVIPGVRGKRCNNLPPTEVEWKYITLTDTHPQLGTLTFDFPSQMVASPLTKVPPLDPTIRGREPHGNIPWWEQCFSKRRREHDEHFWVRGHLLNDNTWGPGDSRNLIPISHVLNTIMEAMVEKKVKDLVDDGKIIEYVVTVNWTVTPEQRRKDYGLLADQTGSLIWGEQFAPTSLSWELYELKIENGSIRKQQIPHSPDWYPDPSQSVNHFPQ